MSKFSAIVCDHCDARDIVDSPVVPIYKVESRYVHIGTDKRNPDLCEKCFNDLSETVFRLTTQQPKMTVSK